MANQRQEERVAVALPVFFDHVQGTTRDVSASGMFFETSSPFAVGEPVNFKIEFDAPNGKMVLQCKGEILRTEVRADRVGVAIKIVESIMGLVDGLECSPEIQL